jgi:tol-pal system protein YbgF
MKYTILPFALIISMFSAAEDGWVVVGQEPAAIPAVKPATVSQQSNNPSPAKPSLQVQLLTMVEMMQQEIAELRGIAEEQNHKIEILQKRQQQRYLDLDRRIADLLSKPIAAVKSNGDVQSNVLPADDLYARSMSFVKKKEFTRALEQLSLFAKTYPKHVLAANAFYWSGEVQLAEGNFALAIKQFETVVYKHPSHNKAGDSHYKLAVSYDRSGNAVKAKALLQQVIKQYPGISDSAVRLAERYLARLQAT